MNNSVVMVSNIVIIHDNCRVIIANTHLPEIATWMYDPVS